MEELKFGHTSVLLYETVGSLNIIPGGCYVAGTLGGGGHALEVLKRLGHGRLIGIDQDEDCLLYTSDTIGGVLFAKVVNVFLKMAGKPPVNPMIGGCGISAFPMSSRVVQKMAAEAEPGNIILMQAAGTNVSGQVASVIAGGLVISIVTQYL